MKTWQIWEKYRKIKGVYLQSDSYPSFQLPNSSKLSTISDCIILSVSIRFIAAEIWVIL